MPTVTIATDNIKVNVAPNYPLIQLGEEYNTSITFGCRDASCGACAVRILDGVSNLSAMDDKEREFLATCDIKEGERLACQCRVLGDVTIDVSAF